MPLQISHEPFHERIARSTRMPRLVARLPRWLTLVALLGLLAVAVSAGSGTLATIAVVALAVAALSLGPVVLVGLALRLANRVDRPPRGSPSKRTRIGPSRTTAPSDD